MKKIFIIIIIIIAVILLILIGIKAYLTYKETSQKPTPSPSPFVEKTPPASPFVSPYYVKPIPLGEKKGTTIIEVVPGEEEKE